MSDNKLAVKEEAIPLLTFDPIKKSRFKYFYLIFL